jgi:hypothetical protein
VFVDGTDACYAECAAAQLFRHYGTETNQFLGADPKFRIDLGNRRTCEHDAVHFVL